jgi:uncharacterized membrane protein
MATTREAAATRNARLLHPGLIAAGAALLIGALVTDIFYWQTSDMQWANFSAWLITAGLILALLAGLALVLDLVLGRAGPISWVHFVALAGAALLSLLNVFVHSRDAWTSVVPQGLMLSIVVTIFLLVIGWRGWSVAAVRTPGRGDRS